MSPVAGSCLRGRADIMMARGNCAAAETDARRMLVVDPKSYRTYEYLALALAGADAPIDGVGEALGKRTALHAEERRAVAAAQAGTWLALLSGDFTAAEAGARAWDAALAGSLIESDHAKALHHLLDALEERGDVATALSEADAFERRSSAWTRDDPLGIRMRIAILRHHAGRIDDKELARVRDDLVREARERRPDLTAGWIWYLSRATFVDTADEAKSAIATMAPEGPPADASGLWEDNLGRILLLAGDAARALPHLERAAKSCSLMSDEESPAATTVWYVRANLFLARAREELHDGEGACKAYAVVTTRWANAKPRSLALEKAKARRAALHCR